jgi:hypothetical protein
MKKYVVKHKQTGNYYRCGAVRKRYDPAFTEFSKATVYGSLAAIKNSIGRYEPNENKTILRIKLNMLDPIIDQIEFNNVYKRYNREPFSHMILPDWAEIVEVIIGE